VTIAGSLKARCAGFDVTGEAACERLVAFNRIFDRLPGFDGV
jgi:hypothetical protein